MGNKGASGEWQQDSRRLGSRFDISNRQLAATRPPPFSPWKNKKEKKREGKETERIFEKERINYFQTRKVAERVEVEVEVLEAEGNN